MTRILFSLREESELLEIVWSGLDSRPAQWSHLLEILAALDHEKSILGDIHGEIEVVCRGPEESELAKWPVATDTAAIDGLRERLRGHGPDRLEMVLQCQPITFLEDDNLYATDWGDADLFDLGSLPLEATDRTTSLPLRQWRIVGGPERWPEQPILYLRAGVELGQSQQIILYPCSHFDLWRPVRFDGEPNPVGQANAAMLHECFERVARRGHGELRSGIEGVAL